MRTQSTIRVLTGLIALAARLTPAAVVGSLLFAFDGSMRWLGLFGLPLLLLALRRESLGCGPRGCGPGSGRPPGAWPAP